MPSRLPGPPPPAEYPDHRGYVELVPEGDVLDRLMEQIHATQALLRGLPNERALHRYAPDKWSVKEVVGHLSDAERIFCARAVAFARGDRTALPGFDHDAYVAAAGFDRRSLSNLIEELAAVRAATLRLFEGLPEEAMSREGVANGKRLSVRALAWVITGHERHHQRILRERYLGA
jgi:hypothetical protein